ncbi:hypothetical protein GCM10007417_12520 [Glycocaulis alkaliphilus]|nr:hypothetical protein GCM10007417_12520 [Glycocaulis alkaliphilus]
MQPLGVLRHLGEDRHRRHQSDENADSNNDIDDHVLSPTRASVSRTALILMCATGSRSGADGKVGSVLKGAVRRYMQGAALVEPLAVTMRKLSAPRRTVSGLRWSTTHDKPYIP